MRVSKQGTFVTGFSCLSSMLMAVVAYSNNSYLGLLLAVCGLLCTISLQLKIALFEEDV